MGHLLTGTLCEWCFTRSADSWADVGSGRLHVCAGCARRVVGYDLTDAVVKGVREGARRRELEFSFLGSRIA